MPRYHKLSKLTIRWIRPLDLSV